MRSVGVWADTSQQREAGRYGRTRTKRETIVDGLAGAHGAMNTKQGGKQHKASGGSEDKNGVLGK